jgi:hypothetical protein
MMNPINVTRSYLAALSLAMALLIPGLAHADAPIVSAGSSIVANEGDTVTLDGSATFDPDEEAVLFGTPGTTNDALGDSALGWQRANQGDFPE